MTLLNQAIDQVRHWEVRGNPLLKNSRWLCLRNRRELTAGQRSDLGWLTRLDSRTGKAYQIKLTLQRLWNFTNHPDAEAFLKRWYFWATHSRMEHFIAVAKTIKRHWKGVLQFVESRITAGIVEKLNSKINIPLPTRS